VSLNRFSDYEGRRPSTNRLSWRKKKKEGNAVRVYILLARRSTIEQKNQLLWHKILVVVT
jgi:hypothetical protein